MNNVDEVPCGKRKEEKTMRNSKDLFEKTTPATQKKLLIFLNFFLPSFLPSSSLFLVGENEICVGVSCAAVPSVPCE